VVIGLCGTLAVAQRQGGTPGGGAGRGGGLVSMPVLGPEPSDKAVIFSTSDLQKKYAEMEAAKAGAWRLVDGSRHS
jgi:hypothetical protein